MASKPTGTPTAGPIIAPSALSLTTEVTTTTLGLAGIDEVDLEDDLNIDVDEEDVDEEDVDEEDIDEEDVDEEDAEVEVADEEEEDEEATACELGEESPAPEDPRSSKEKRLLVVSQHPGCGRLVSQQKLPGLHSCIASFPDAVSNADIQESPRFDRYTYIGLGSLRSEESTSHCLDIAN
ncbi:MAG: hypothetical protein Q9217_003998 [Psora testacea]